MKKRDGFIASIITILSSVFAFIGIISCCGFPILASILAYIGLGASQLQALAPYQNYFLVLAILSLIYGFYSIYFKRRPKKTSSDCCNISIEEVKENKPNDCCNISIEEVKENKPNDCCNVSIEEVKENKPNDCCNNSTKKALAKESDNCCNNTSNKLSKIMLWGGVIAVLLAIIATKL
ncbi:hypothetical protein K4L44_08055 [Halosquirtibacter laminarini]|uniref:Uncharacterized protein n=1 Tax=Halosquirtibacter laminarini TaxID=3374600 RepID=A0AC61NJ56_9BACT|nr:hypothetical protein K4L44_08055 [Prolixibacteraceae bacterium]